MNTANPNRHFRSGFSMHARDPIDLPNASDASLIGAAICAGDIARAVGRGF